MKIQKIGIQIEGNNTDLLRKCAYFLDLSLFNFSQCGLISSLTTVGGESARYCCFALASIDTLRDPSGVNESRELLVVLALVELDSLRCCCNSCTR